ncbi:E3 ubiquitin-protein ligase rnf213-alpha-like [Amphiura filiformis]|uniref:E3 ubiquitin-protein ligase rnf213-alpha-like n=1 Tax=Amphiura filiformis TaxID=82378 RepID=UPI003B20E4A9
MREINEDGKEEENERVYTLEKLRDLQSKLTLVAGKTQEDRQGLQAKVEQFVQVFTAAQQLASTYTKLNSAGCILFKEWKAVLYCSSLGKVSVLVDFGASEQLLLKGTRPLMVELRFLREFMDECLTQWHHYVDEQRSKCYELNYYTTEQLVMLRQNLAQFTTNKKDLPAQIYVLLSSVKQMCKPGDIDVALKAAMRQVALEAAPAPMEAEAIDAPEVNEADILNQKKLLAKKLVDEFLFEESMALAAVEAVGLEYADGGLEEYLDWCLQNEQNAELIQELVTGLQAQGIRLSDDMTDEATIGKEMDYDDDISRLAEEEEMSFPSMALSVHELTESLLREINRGDLKNQLKQLWQNHLHSMKSMDVEDCLSLEHLGIILHHLNQANSHQPDRKFPTFLKTGQPNLIVRSAGDIWTTVLSLYMHEGGHLPTQEEVLICNTATTLEQVLLLWRRALSDQLKRVFCLVRADLLDYDVSVKAEQQLLHLMQGKAGYHLVILSSSEREDSSHIVTALDQYRVDIPGVPPIADIQHYLRQELEAQAQSVQNTTRVHPAAMITPHGCTVEVIVSSRPGVGKSLAIKRYAQKLCKHLGRNSGDKVLVTMPLQTAQVEEDIVVSALLPYQQASYTTSPRIFHLDVAPMVKDGLDHLLFNLLILGGLCNSHGKAWKRKPQDLYVVEITDFTLQHRHSRHSSKHTTHPFYALLPSVTCRAPQEVLYAMHRSAVWPRSDPKVDEEEFKSEAYQRTFQYLMRREQNANLDDFNFQSNSVEGTRKQFLETLLRNCGVIDPSWAELRHFAHFLSIQLQDCQQSTFCIPELLADTGLQGFKSFVVKFMVQMAKDFATPSLNMSEESPSKAMLLLGNNDGRGNGQQADIPELAAFQLRRRWESSFHPYIFFNHDHESMTFMGFIINQQGFLIDSTRRQIIEPGLMTPELRGGLQLQRVDLNTDFDQLSRVQKLMALCMVLGVEDVTDPDDTYELTTDNVKKMLAIHMRFRCGIPVVIMGETGCGKTRLIRFLCHLQAGWHSMQGLNNMILMKVHGGTTAKDILKKVKGAEEKARRNKQEFGVDTVLFFDEANTTEAIGLIKEIMCDGRSNGEHINMADGALKIVAACNPYRRHSEDMIKRLKTAGLGYHVSAENAQEKLGSIPLRELVYRVQALPPSMLPLVWDFGQLGTDVETKYIRQIVQRHVRPGGLANDRQADVITRVLAASHDFMRSQKNECSFVSLRDVERCLEVMVWFYNRMDMLKPLMDRLRREEEPVMDRLRTEEKPVMGHLRREEKAMMHHLRKAEMPVMDRLTREEKPEMDRLRGEEKPMMHHLRREEMPVMDRLTREDMPEVDRLRREEKPVMGRLRREKKPVMDRLTREEKPEMDRLRREEKPIMGRLRGEEKPLMHHLRKEEIPVMDRLTIEETPVMDCLRREEKPVMGRLIREKKPVIDNLEREEKPVMNYLRREEKPVMARLRKEEKPVMARLRKEEKPVMDHFRREEKPRMDRFRREEKPVMDQLRREPQEQSRQYMRMRRQQEEDDEEAYLPSENIPVWPGFHKTTQLRTDQSGANYSRAWPSLDKLHKFTRSGQAKGSNCRSASNQFPEKLQMSLVLALGVCYHACLQTSRAAYRKAVSRVFKKSGSLPGGAAQMQEEISRCQDVFLAELELPPNIARNSALKENIFMMVVCIELRIPLFLVGKPGSSKSLAKSIVADAMQGDAAHSELFKNFKQVYMISFQCSPLSTPDGIVGTFKQCSRFQEGKDLNRFVSVVVLDEVGLAEDSPRMPLKTLHPLLETGSEEDEDSPAAHKKVGFVGLSNWALDPAKMNRGILVSREEPDEKELVNTARGICAGDPVQDLIEPLIPSLAKAYLSLYKNQKREFFGLRDYYSLIKMVYSFSSKSDRSPTHLEIEHSVRRNFGGLLGAEDPMRHFEKYMQMTALAEATPDDLDCSPAGLLQASLQGHATGEGESRYLLVLTENYAALPILRQQLLSQQDTIIIFVFFLFHESRYLLVLTENYAALPILRQQLLSQQDTIIIFVFFLFHESRYLLVLTENYAALPILRQQLLSQQDAIIIFVFFLFHESRYLLVLTENYAALPILRQQLLSQQDAIIIFVFFLFHESRYLLVLTENYAALPILRQQLLSQQDAIIIFVFFLFHESRYLLVLTENYAALPILRQQLLSQQDAIIIFGSSFPYDQEYTQVCRNISKIKVCMETGRTVVLLNLENLYESLYDALNQYYVKLFGQRYVDLGLGTHRVKCRVHNDFRLIVIADKDVVYERFPTPLINRLEKHFLATSTMLTMDQREIVTQLEQWVKKFATIVLPAYKMDNYKFAISDAFVGYHDDTLASLVYQICCEMGQAEGHDDWKYMVRWRLC